MLNCSVLFSEPPYSTHLLDQQRGYHQSSEKHHPQCKSWLISVDYHGFVKTLMGCCPVIPTEAGIQSIEILLKHLDFGACPLGRVRWRDNLLRVRQLFDEWPAKQGAYVGSHKFNVAFRGIPRTAECMNVGALQVDGMNTA
jgi:hypothetical protein